MLLSVMPYSGVPLLLPSNEGDIPCFAAALEWKGLPSCRVCQLLDCLNGAGRRVMEFFLAINLWWLDTKFPNPKSFRCSAEWTRGSAAAVT